LLNTRPAIFEAGLQIMAADLPGKIIDELIVAVDAMSGVPRCRTGLRKEAAARGS